MAIDNASFVQMLILPLTLILTLVTFDINFAYAQYINILLN